MSGDALHVTYTEDPVFPGDWFADLRDSDGIVVETGSGTTKEAAYAHLCRRYRYYQGEDVPEAGYGFDEHVAVKAAGTMDVWLPGQECVTYLLPGEARQFIKRFDDEFKVEAFTFTARLLTEDGES